MKHYIVTRSLVCLAFTCAALSFASDQKSAPCKQPPDFVSMPKPSKEERQMNAQGIVEVVVSEEGDVVEARVVRATSEEAGKLLLERAKAAKFRPRQGCGEFRLPMNFTLAGS